MIGETILRHLQLIGRLSDRDRQAVLSLQGETRELRPGEDILKVGEHPTFSVVVLRGLLQRYKTSALGRRQIHSFYLPTDTPSMEAIPLEVMDNSLAAVTHSVVGLVSHAELHRVMDANPKVLELIWRDTLIQGAVFREWLMRNSQMLAHAQLAHFFCEIMLRARVAGLARGDFCDLPITQEHLADALGMSAVHVNRTLAMLRAAKLAEFRGGVLTVPDWDKLAEVAEFDAGYLHLYNAVDSGFSKGGAASTSAKLKRS